MSQKDEIEVTVYYVHDQIIIYSKFILLNKYYLLMVFLNYIFSFQDEYI